jgi:hypothetical protein
MKKKFLLGTAVSIAMLGTLTVPVSAQIIGSNTGNSTVDNAVSNVASKVESLSDEAITNIVKSALSKLNLSDSEIKDVVNAVKKSDIDLSSRDSIIAYATSYIDQSLTIGASGSKVTTVETTTAVSAEMRTVKFPTTDVVVKWQDGSFSGTWNSDTEKFGTLEGSYSSKSVKGKLTVGSDVFTIKGTYDDNYKVTFNINGFTLTGYIDPDTNVAVLTPNSNQNYNVTPDSVTVEGVSSSTTTGSGTEGTTVVTEKETPSTGDQMSPLAVLLTGGTAAASAFALRKKSD